MPDRPSDRDRVRAGRLRRSLKPMRLGAKTAAGRAALAARSIGANPDKRDERARAFHERTARLYAEELGDMKGALMKFGQIMAFVDAGAVPTRYRDIYARAMGSLFASAPPMPHEVLDEVVIAELGGPAKEVFAWFSPDPMAAASIGQVHEARLDDGSRVAVKVQYPGVAEAIDDDLSNVEMLATFMRLGQSVMGGLGGRVDTKMVAGEIRERISEELDYVLEARNQEVFCALYEDHPFIRIPRTVPDLSTSRVLTMEYVDGMVWDDALKAPWDLRQRWAEVLYRFVIGSLDRYSVFNADPHPGNYIFHPDGTVTFLDFGCVKYMPVDQMHRNIGLIRAVFDRRADDFKAELVRGGFLPADDDIPSERLLEWYYSALGPHWESRPYTFTHEGVAQLVRKMYDPLGEFGGIVRRMTVPKDFALMTRIDLGVWSIMASLEATNDWHGIAEEIWGVGPPATELGRLDAAWQERMRERGDWPPAFPERPQRFKSPIASEGFDPLEADFQTDPYPDYARLRSQGRVHWMPPGAYLIPRYGDCADLLRDPRLSADPTTSELYKDFVPAMFGEGSALDRVTQKLLLFMDPPDHERLRSLVSNAFTRRAVESLKPRIKAIADELLDPIADRREMDVVSDLAYPLPIQVIAELLGVPMDDRDRFGAWSKDLVSLLSVDAPMTSDGERGNETIVAFLDYFRDLADERRRLPQDDLLTALVEASSDGSQLSVDELLATCVLLLVAGHETTANLIANGTVALLRSPDSWLRLVREPTLVPNAVEELLRFDSPVQGAARTTLEEIEIGGKRVAAGQRVILLLGSANRDPSVFDEPDELRLDRGAGKHLSFGSGIHFCLGAPLARLEARIAFETMATRMPNLRLTSTEIEWKSTFPIRGPERLPVCW